MHILRGTPATLELSVYNDGTLTDLDATPTLEVTDANGTVVTTGAVSSPGTGVYRSLLDAQTELADLTALWEGELSTVPVSFTQGYEVVGNHLFTEAEARAAETSGGLTPLSDTAKYTDAEIIRCRELITERFESVTKRSWIRRYARIELHGNGQRYLNLSRGIPRDINGSKVAGAGWFRDVARIISATDNGDVVDPTDLFIDRYQVFHTTDVWTQATVTTPLNIILEVEYGDDGSSYEAHENALRAAIATLVKSDISSWAETFSTPEGTERYPAGGLLFPPTVNDWLTRNKAKYAKSGRWGVL